MNDTRIEELHEAYVAACRRVSAARGRLTRASKDGSDVESTAALARLRALEAEADAIGGERVPHAQRGGSTPTKLARRRGSHAGHPPGRQTG
jgi:hypothetical protein